MLLTILLIIISLIFCPLSHAGIDFDNTDDNVSFGDVDAIDNATAITGCAWVFHDTTAGDDVIWQKNNSTTDGIRLFRDNACDGARTDCYTIRLWDSADVDNCTVSGATNSSPVSTWTHVCFTWAAGGNVRLYVNAVEDANSPGSCATVAAVDSGANALLLGGTASAFDGQISDFAIWTAELTAAEISQLYQSRVRYMPLQVQTSSCLIYTPIDDQPDGTSFDGDIIFNKCGSTNGTGVDGANNTGLLAIAETNLSYP